LDDLFGTGAIPEQKARKPAQAPVMLVEEPRDPFVALIGTATLLALCPIGPLISSVRTVAHL
jgi:hypothetical protein